MEVPSVIKWVADVLWALPAPTESWANIIGSLAWPGTTLFVVIRFRRYIRNFLNTLSERLVTDHVKIGLFELTPNSEVIRLDQKADDEESGHTIADQANMELLFEFISEPANDATLQVWLNENFGPALSLVDFLTEEPYAGARARAVSDLMGE